MTDDLDLMLQKGLRRLHQLRPEKLPMAVDTETTGFRVGGDATTIGVSVAIVTPEGKDFSLYVPIAHAAGQNANAETIDMLAWTLENWLGPLVFANVIFDVLALEDFGCTVEHGDLWDVILMAHLINENTPRTKSLESLAQHYVNEELVKAEDDFVKDQKKRGWPDTTWQQMWVYATVDTELTLAVYEVLVKLLPGEVPEGIWAHKQEFFRTLLAMRRYGVRIDDELAREHVGQAEREMFGAKQLLGLTVGETLGPKALERIIHGELGIPVLHTTPSGKPGFDSKNAMPLYEPYLERAESPVAGALKTYRGWQKSSTAASIPYLELMDSDGRLRCSYKMHGTVTGRLSCEKPNLQQIPKSSTKPWNGQLKEQFIAEPGYTLINADFSQLELRLGTAYAGEPDLKQVFLEGRDIFTEMAAQLGWDRNRTKTFVYSVQYGAGVKRIMAAFGVTKAEAEAMILNYKRTFPRFARTADRVARAARRDGRIKLWSGRWRRFQYPEREDYKAWNSLIQGGGADIVERCLVRCFQELHSDDCRMLLQVHDSITWEVRDELVPEMMPAIKATMEDVTGYTGYDFGVRFAVDVDYWSKREAAKHALAA